MHNKYKKPVVGLVMLLIIASFYGCNNQGSDDVNKKTENINLKYESPEHRYLGAGVELSIPQEDGNVRKYWIGVVILQVMQLLI